MEKILIDGKEISIEKILNELKTFVNSTELEMLLPSFSLEDKRKILICYQKYEKFYSEQIFYEEMKTFIRKLIDTDYSEFEGKITQSLMKKIVKNHKKEFQNIVTSKQYMPDGINEFISVLLSTSIFKKVKL